MNVNLAKPLKRTKSFKQSSTYYRHVKQFTEKLRIESKNPTKVSCTEELVDETPSIEFAPTLLTIPVNNQPPFSQNKGNDVKIRFVYAAN